MTDYVKSTSFSLKDSLPSGDPMKIVRGTEIDTEFNNIATAVATKADINSPALSGVPTAPTASAGTSTTQIATCAFVGSAVGTASPTGSIAMWPTNSAPSGYLLCAGAAVSRTTYAALFAIIGTTFGAGDGSTTFNLPDYRDRMPIGAGTSYSVNTKGGSKDAIVVAHTHSGTTTANGAHNHLVYGEDATGSPNGGAYNELGDVANAGAANAYFSRTTSTASDHTHTFTTNSTGSSGTDANLPPYIGIQFIIKT